MLASFSFHSMFEFSPTNCFKATKSTKDHEDHEEIKLFKLQADHFPGQLINGYTLSYLFIFVLFVALRALRGLISPLFFAIRRLLAELNFKASHTGIGRIPVTILIFRPGNFRPKLKKEPGPVKIPAIP
jgi:hypothetical protein